MFEIPRLYCLGHSQAGTMAVLSNLLSVLGSEQGVFDRQYGLDRKSEIR